MSRVVPVTSFDLPALQPYRTLRRQQEHKVQGIFVAEGEKVVRRLLASELTVVSILVTPTWHQELFSDGTTPPCDVYVAEESLLNTIVGFRLHQGIMAVGSLPEEKSLSEVLSSLHSPLLIVALDGLANAENVGVIVRNCGGFGVQAILVGGTSASPYLRRAVRNSMGAVFRIPVVHVLDLASTLLTMKNRLRIIATSPHESTTIHLAHFTDDICIVLGNEDTGIAPEILQLSDERVAIPMLNETDSLNVASASAVCLYEVQRQRNAIVA